MMSPLERIRKELGLSRTEFARTLGVEYNPLYQAEVGMKMVPSSALQALAELGFDTDALQAEQAQWIQTRARELRAELAGRAKVGVA